MKNKFIVECGIILIALYSGINMSYNVLRVIGIK